MHSVDVLVLAFMLVHGVAGALRGFLWQIVRIGALALSVWITWSFGPTFGTWIPEGWLTDTTGRTVVGYGLGFFTTFALGLLVGRLLRSLIERKGLSTTDRSLGFFLGLFKGALWVALVLHLSFPLRGLLPDAIQHSVWGHAEQGIAASRAAELYVHLSAEHQLKGLSPEQRARLIRQLSDSGG